MTKNSQSQFDFPSFNSRMPDFSRLPNCTPLILTSNDYRFFRIDEMTEHKAAEFRAAMMNVISTMVDLDGQTNKSNIVYLLSGRPEGISLYLGLAGNSSVDEIEQLKSAFEGNFLGAKAVMVRNDSVELQQMFNATKHLGVVTGIPSFNENKNTSEEDFQSIERLINTLSGEVWQMIVVAETGSEVEIRAVLDQIYELSSRLSSIVRYSEQKSVNKGENISRTTGSSETDSEGSSETHGENDGTSTSVTKGTSNSKGDGKNSKGESQSAAESQNQGTNHSLSKSLSKAKGINASETKGENQGESIAFTREHIDKDRELSLQHLNESQITRFQQGLGKGMFRTAVYICAENKNTYNRLARSLLSLFQGGDPVAVPLNVQKLTLDKHPVLLDFLQIRRVAYKDFQKQEDAHQIITKGLPQYADQSVGRATWLTAKELSLLFSLPTIEVSGLKLRKSVSFALNTVAVGDDAVNLGNVVQDGRELVHKPILLPKNALDKHIFVTGVTGAGKTTTCMNLLLGADLPFTVIEPAKTEYRALYGQGKEIQYYALGREDLTTFRLNPFELVSPHQNLTGHISMLKATMAAVFPMEASMPFIVEQAIIQAYQKKGWDIAANTNYLVEDPWNGEENAFPTFSDMIAELDKVIKSAGMGREFEEKYRGSLVSRLTALTTGIRGTMINTPRSIDFDKLLDQNVVIELEELKDEEDKAFFMGLIIGRFAECVKQRHRTQHDFRHITLVEEAHRLLADPSFGEDSAKKLGVEMFANLLAEVRKYGESLVIADQIPNKLVSDVIKNTNTKIVHRLFAADDRDAIGDAMGLSREQKDFLPLLQPGETVVFSGGWHAPVRAQMSRPVATDGKEIDEAAIRKQGAAQLWQQRQVLFPALIAQGDFEADSFAGQILTMRKQLNMFVTLIKMYHEEQHEQAEKVWLRLADSVRQLLEQQQWNNTQLCLHWLALWLDTDVLDISHKYSVKRNQENLHELFSFLIESLLNGTASEFHRVQKHDIKDCFNQFRFI